MNQGRTCIIAGHDLQITHVCLFQSCDQQSRWLCQKCNNAKLHNHGSDVQEQIVSMKQFEKMMIEKKKIINKTYDQIGNILAVSINLSKNIQSIVEFVKGLQKQKFSNAAWLTLNEIKDFSRLYVLESEAIEQLVVASRDLNFSQELMNQVNILKVETNKFDQIYNHLNQLNKKEEKFLVESIILQDLSKVQAQIQSYKYQAYSLQSEFQVNTIQVSNNLKYIAAGGNIHLTIWNHQNLQVLHQFQLLNQISILKFTFDALTLFVASQDGYIYQFLSEKSFQNILRLRIHQQCINQIQLINNNVIITCDQNEIKKTDCSKSETLLILKTNAIDIDYDIVSNQILSNNTQNVSLWNGIYGYVIIDKKFDSPLNSGIKFVGNFNSILVNFADYGFKQYNIDQKKKQLELVRWIDVDYRKVLSFALALKQQFIAFFDQYSIEIRSFSGIVIQTINHELKFNDQHRANEDSNCDQWNINQIIQGYLIYNKQNFIQNNYFNNSLRQLIGSLQQKPKILEKKIMVKYVCFMNNQKQFMQQNIWEITKFDHLVQDETQIVGSFDKLFDYSIEIKQQKTPKGFKQVQDIIFELDAMQGFLDLLLGTRTIEAKIDYAFIEQENQRALGCKLKSVKQIKKNRTNNLEKYSQKLQDEDNQYMRQVQQKKMKGSYISANQLLIYGGYFDLPKSNSGLYFNLYHDRFYSDQLDLKRYFLPLSIMGNDLETKKSELKEPLNKRLIILITNQYEHKRFKTPMRIISAPIINYDVYENVILYKYLEQQDALVNNFWGLRLEFIQVDEDSIREYQTNYQVDKLVYTRFITELAGKSEQPMKDFIEYIKIHLMDKYYTKNESIFKLMVKKNYSAEFIYQYFQTN
ncbi:hypothetical protein pb186bvf_006374 [Paramecium bursaria]